MLRQFGPAVLGFGGMGGFCCTLSASIRTVWLQMDASTANVSAGRLAWHHSFEAVSRFPAQAWKKATLRRTNCTSCLFFRCLTISSIVPSSQRARSMFLSFNRQRRSSESRRISWWEHTRRLFASWLWNEASTSSKFVKTIALGRVAIIIRVLFCLVSCWTGAWIHVTNLMRRSQASVFMSEIWSPLKYLKSKAAKIVNSDSKWVC